MMDSRTIDFAKTASIDMMTLNNKVVNMRQVVKRTKVHVISKLCRHINALKKKKGTEEQKAKNLRKAQRYLEEIDSIKKLKEDKVSKYALANTTAFSDVSKSSLSPAPRALARLAEYPLMKKVVADFREQHSDWRDLAAYLLVKQTGRRFKTKKQKQKKLARCIENINASETMTKSYIQERFGQEGLTQAEQRFERKRKRPKSANSASKDHAGDKGQQLETGVVESCDEGQQLDTKVLVSEDGGNKQQKKEGKPSRDADLIESSKKSVVEQRRKDYAQLDQTVGQFPKEENNECEASEDEREVEAGNAGNFQESRITSEVIDKFGTGNNTITNSNDVSSCELENDYHKSQAKTYKTAQRNECVVKELRLEATNEGSSSSSSSSEDENGVDEDSESNSSVDQLENGHYDRQSWDKKKKKIPEFLTKANHQTAISDPFFVGCDNDGENDIEDYNDQQHDDDHLSENDSDKLPTTSMFYNPGSGGTNRGYSQWSQRGRGHKDSFERKGSERGQRSNFERRGGSGRFNNSHRGRTFRGEGRGRGRNFGAEKGSHFQESPSQPSYSKKSSNVNHRGTEKHAASDRLHDKTPDGIKITLKDKTADRPGQEKLHPSWEASKKRKAEQGGLQAFQGSKITFDDDD